MVPRYQYIWRTDLLELTADSPDSLLRGDYVLGIGCAADGSVSRLLLREQTADNSVDVVWRLLRLLLDRDVCSVIRDYLAGLWPTLSTRTVRTTEIRDVQSLSPIAAVAEVEGGLDPEQMRRCACTLLRRFGLGLSVVDLSTGQSTPLSLADCLVVRCSAAPFRWKPSGVPVPVSSPLFAEDRPADQFKFALPLARVRVSVALPRDLLPDCPSRAWDCATIVGPLFTGDSVPLRPLSSAELNSHGRATTSLPTGNMEGHRERVHRRGG
jgi:hypothetical protein